MTASGSGICADAATIAHHLVERFPHLSVLILSGSPIIGSFDFKARVDFVRVPGVIKLRNGEYTSLGLHPRPRKTLAIRRSIIQHTAEIYEPDLFLVDKEPLGLRGEVGPTLELLKRRGTLLVLGLRDVMDDRRSWSTSGSEKGVSRPGASSTTRSGSMGCRRSSIPCAGSRAWRRWPQKMQLNRLSAADGGRGDARRRRRGTRGTVYPGHAGGGGDGAELIEWVHRRIRARSRAAAPR